MSDSAVAHRWNHNLHYHPVLLAAVPPGAHLGLDVGCGEGMLSRALAGRVGHVTGIDLDEPSIDLARRTTPQDNVDYALGDIMTHPLEAASFDVIVSVATMHHLDIAAALARFAELLRPGGVLGIVGIGRRRLPHDLGWEVAASISTQVLKRTGGRAYWEHSAPIVWPPPHTYDQVRRISAELLPGSVFRRRNLWRYTLQWTKPG